MNEKRLTDVSFRRCNICESNTLLQYLVDMNYLNLNYTCESNICLSQENIQAKCDGIMCII